MKINTIIICLVIIVSSCRCGTLECEPNDFSGSYRFIDRRSKDDLFFGPNKSFDKTHLKFFELNNNDTTFLNYKIELNPVNQTDSVITIELLNKNKTIYLKLNSLDTDTIINRFEDNKTKCCGTISTLDGVSINKNREVTIFDRVFILEK